MGYFRELPDLAYQSFLSDSLSSQSYLIVKNLFRRNKLRDDLKDVVTVFEQYQIPDGVRPDVVAEEFYGSAELDWVVLMTAGIINVRDEWPLTNYQLYRYVEKKYGVEKLNETHHYETKEIKDSSGRLILPAGKVVNEGFVLNYYDKDNSENPLVLKDGVDVRTGISNYIYETRKNEEKSSISLLRREYLQQFLNDMRSIMRYSKSSQYISDSLIQTENTRVTISN